MVMDLNFEHNSSFVKDKTSEVENFMKIRLR